jgi:hypothetical protein
LSFRPCHHLSDFLGFAKGENLRKLQAFCLKQGKRKKLLQNLKIAFFLSLKNPVKNLIIRKRVRKRNFPVDKKVQFKTEIIKNLQFSVRKSALPRFYLTFVVFRSKMALGVTLTTPSQKVIFPAPSNVFLRDD